MKTRLKRVPFNKEREVRLEKERLSLQRAAALMKSRSTAFAIAYLEQKHSSKSFLLELSRSVPGAHAALLEVYGADARIDLESIARNPDQKIREKLARDPRCPPGLWQNFIDDPSIGVRRAVAGRHDLEDRLTAKLLFDPEPCVRHAAASRRGAIRTTG